MVEQAQDTELRLHSAMALAATLLEGLESFEGALRRLHPPQIPELQMYLRGPSARLRSALESFEEIIAATPDEKFRGFEQRLCEGARAGLRATRLFAEAGRAARGFGEILGAMQQHCVAQEAAFSLRRSVRPFSQFFLEPFARDQWEELDPESSPVSTGAGVGIQDARNGRELRGGFSLYVPESYQGEAWPLVVALHGGSGHGADFLWTWLREARSRQFLLLAPTAQGSTWSFHGPDVDSHALSSMLGFVQDRWNVDSNKILLTGLSDGATYSLLCGLQEGMPFTAMAPVSGVLHPANFENGNLDRVAGRRIYLVHGALDWMFPIELARVAAEELSGRGADLVFREIDDLSHTYPREQNAKILDWFLSSSG